MDTVAFDTIEQPVIKEHFTTPQAEAEVTSHWYIFLFMGVLAILILLKVFAKKKIVKRYIYLVGERNSGKTQLFYKLQKAKQFETVPSVKNNVSEFTLSSNRQKLMVDVTGDNHTKEEFLASIAQAFCIVQVVDGCETSKFTETAELLYRILISKAYQREEPQYIIFLNKQDRPDFMGEKMFAKKLEEEIERIKLSRKAMIEDREGEEDLLREQTTRFNLEENNIRILSGSVVNDTKQLESFIESL